MMLRFYTTTLIALALTGCAAQTTPPESTATTCTDPRPQICTMDYRPVCATKENGQQGTYSNGCAACGDDEVTSFEPGLCPTE